jgi:peptidoglycan/xylan/chitin deacetylase (PgdA/CDA1 family)
MTPAAAAMTFFTTGGVAFGALAWVSVAPTSSFWGSLYSHGPTAQPGRYALTFDDGPTLKSTTAILDTLAELDAKATFFVIGANARNHPALLQRMHAEGHIVANHTLHHHHLSMFRGGGYWLRELAETDRIIEDAIGLRPAMFRPPMGVKTWHVMHAATARGQAVITWSRRGVDGISTTSDRILRHLLPTTVAGDVLLLHDGVEPQSRRDPGATVAAVRPLIMGLRNRGLEPAPLDAFLQLPAYATATSATPAA